ncbi:MAG: electron transfer flavoprotein subunit beta/FixA family protein [Candidatus Dormibacteria bacterium]
MDRNLEKTIVKVIVCVKQIPDPGVPGELVGPSHTLKREGVTVVLDPGDEFGVEAGLTLAEANGGEVVLVSMGPERGTDALRKGLAMGASKGILISDPALAGADALTTATVLAAAIRKEGFDCIITATESTDGYSGVIPQMLATLLEVPAVSFAKSIILQGNSMKVKRQTESGTEDAAVNLPCVVSVTAGVNEPRYPTLKGILGAKSKQIEICTVESLGTALPGVFQQVTDVQPIASRGSGEIITDDGSAAMKIVEFLTTVKVL